jgi:hypothetical protein
MAHPNEDLIRAQYDASSRADLDALRQGDRAGQPRQGPARRRGRAPLLLGWAPMMIVFCNS